MDSVGGGNQVNSPLAESMNNEDERSEVFTSKADLDSSLDEQDGFDRSPLYTLTEDTEPEPDDDTDTWALTQLSKVHNCVPLDSYKLYM